MPTSLGRVQPIFKGAYDSATTYKKLDNVFYNGDTWVCQIDNTVNVTPSAESNAWQMVASKGRTGGFGAPSGSAEMLPQGFNPTINITASGPDTEKIFNFQFGIPAGADGTQIYLSSVAPTLSGGYNYFPTTALLSPSGVIGGSPRQGDLVFYHNSYYQAAGVTDPTLGARCGQAYTLVIGTASDQQVQDAVDEYLSNHTTVTGTFTNEAKNALLTLLEKVAYTVSNGQTYLDALRTELFRVNVDSISAVFTQGSAVIYDTDTLDRLKQYLAVTANYSDSTSATVTDYTLSGTLTAGTSTITVSYGGKTTTFSVTVNAVLYNLQNKAIVSTDTDDYFETGINVCQADFACTIFLDMTTTSNATSGSANPVPKYLFEFNHTTEVMGRCLTIGKQDAPDTVLRFWWMSTAANDYYTLTGISPDPGHFRFAVMHDANSDLAVVKCKKDSGEILTLECTRTFIPALETDSFSFGTSGNHGLPLGTIHLARICEGVASADRISEFFE